MTTGRRTDAERGRGWGICAAAPLSTRYRVLGNYQNELITLSLFATTTQRIAAPREIARRALKQKCCPLRGNGFLICCAGHAMPGGRERFYERDTRTSEKA